LQSRNDICLIYAICVCLHIVVSNIYCVVFLFCFPSSCVPYVVSLSRLSTFDCPFCIFTRTFIYIKTLFNRLKNNITSILAKLTNVWISDTALSVIPEIMGDFWHSLVRIKERISYLYTVFSWPAIITWLFANKLII
jgi:hypothetical protein